jgi:NitT/TauT family transport system ATP-binding protein
MLYLSDISKEFRLNGTPLPVLRDVSVEVNPGEVLVILGMSGCGKSTLLKIVAGLLPADSGQVLLEGTPITSSNPEIGIVFQSYTVFPWMTVLKNIESGLNHSVIRSEERLTRARKFLDLVGLSEFANAWPSTLSGGMQQRVALARTYAMNPKVLLMDEPFGALDALTRRSMQREFLRIHSSEKKATIFVTHDVDEAITVGDRIVVLSSRPARIVAEFTSPKNAIDKESSELSKISLKSRIGAIFRTFEDISLIMSGLTPDISDDINKAEYVDAIRTQIIKDNHLAESVRRCLDSWDNMTGSQRQYITNLLLGVIRNNDSYRKEIFDFAVEKYEAEQDTSLKVQLIFTAFHAGGGISEEYEDKLEPMINWIGSHLREYDSACKGYYGKSDDEAIERLEKRLDDPLYKGALPLYILNLRSFPEYTQRLKDIINKYVCDDRETIRKTIEIMARQKQVRSVK